MLNLGGTECWMASSDIPNDGDWNHMDTQDGEKEKELLPRDFSRGWDPFASRGCNGCLETFHLTLRVGITLQHFSSHPLLPGLKLLTFVPSWVKKGGWWESSALVCHGKMLGQEHLAGRKDPDSIAVILFPAQGLQNPAENLRGQRKCVAASTHRNLGDAQWEVTHLV